MTTIKYKKITWLGHWQYGYMNEIISLDMTYGNPNTYRYYLHGTKESVSGFGSEWDAKVAAKKAVEQKQNPII